MALRSFQRLASLIKPKNFTRNCYALTCYDEKDPAPLFFDSKVQAILKRLTGKNMDKIFKKRELENPTALQQIKFLTKEDLEELMAETNKEAERLLQMPPVVKERKDSHQVLSYDPALQGTLNAKIIFTDISMASSDRSRLIVVRERDGTLRQATWEERDRMNHIFNPRLGKFHKIPELFLEESYLKDALDRGEYSFVLDFACAQFEPDDPLFHRTTAHTYEHIRKNSAFESLHSTRHFGPMCFFFAWNNTIDNLLLTYIQEERLEEAVDLVHLHHLAKARTEPFSEHQTFQQQVDCLKKYIDEASTLKSNLELALAMCAERIQGREDFEKKVKTSHGIS